MDVIKDIAENVEEGLEAIEEVVEEVAEEIGIISDKKESSEEDASLSSEDKKISLDTEQEKSMDIAKEKAEKLSPKDFEKKGSEKDSTTSSAKEKTLGERKKELLKKVKKISKKVDVVKTANLKEQIKLKKRADMLIPLEDYIKTGIYLGTKVVTPNMKPFVYRRRADGLAIFNTDLIDEKLKEGIEYLSEFAPEDIILVCKRPAGWKAAKMFSKYTGINVFTKKYPAGILTNTNLPDFFENELTIVTDSWLDRNALNDTVNVHKKVLMISDTNNFTKGANQVIIGNNKAEKSLGVIFYLLTRGYCKARKIDSDIPDLEVWTGEE